MSVDGSVAIEVLEDAGFRIARVFRRVVEGGRLAVYEACKGDICAALYPDDVDVDMLVAMLARIAVNAMEGGVERRVYRAGGAKVTLLRKDRVIVVRREAGDLRETMIYVAGSKRPRSVEREDNTGPVYIV